MQLDFNPKTGWFILRIPRGYEGMTIKSAMNDYGLDFSITASTEETAVLITREPYAAASFAHVATPRALAEMEMILAQIRASMAKESAWRPRWTPPDRELWPFQCADLDYALQRENTLVADQPGLGKTPIAISFANEIKAKHVLVIGPANIRGQWAKRIREWSLMSWTLGRDCVVHPITTARRGVAPTNELAASWNIVSYDLARTPAIQRAIVAGRYDLLIIDEAHYLKTIDSKRSLAILGVDNPAEDALPSIMSRCAQTMMLTGTPLPNRPREAYTLARALNWDSIDWMEADDFYDRFNPRELVTGFRPDGTEYRYVNEKSGRHPELQNRMRANFMTRHEKREVMTDLHMPVYDLISLDEDQAIKRALEAEKLLDIDPEHLEGASAKVLGQIATARRMMGVAMAPQIAEYVAMLVEGGEDKLLVFAWHHEVLDILSAKLRKYGVVQTDGRTSAARKERNTNDFIKDPGVHVYVGQMQSMGTGTDGLQEVCSHALIAEPDWVPGTNIQCFDRLDRGGQRGQVQGDIFVVPGSLAERVLASALRKLAVTDAALDRRLV